MQPKLPLNYVAEDNLKLLPRLSSASFTPMGHHTHSASGAKVEAQAILHIRQCSTNWAVSLSLPNSFVSTFGYYL